MGNLSNHTPASVGIKTSVIFPEKSFRPEILRNWSEISLHRPIGRGSIHRKTLGLAVEIRFACEFTFCLLEICPSDFNGIPARIYRQFNCPGPYHVRGYPGKDRR
jgi:hypothetical protein